MSSNIQNLPAIPAEGFFPGEPEVGFVESLPFFLVFPSIFPGGELVFPECPESSVSAGASAGIAVDEFAKYLKKKLSVLQPVFNRIYREKREEQRIQFLSKSSYHPLDPYRKY